MACLEGEIRIVGAVSAARKTKSLVQRWLAKAVDIVMPVTGEPDALARLRSLLRGMPLWLWM